MSHNLTSHRYLIFRSLAQRHTNSVAYAVGQKRTYAHGRFDTAFGGIASFGNSQMERVVHILGGHTLHEQPHSVSHQRNV